MNNAVFGIGIALVIAGITVLALGGLTENTKFAFVGFIGPFPVGFGNDKGLLIAGLVVAIIIFLLLARLP